jgi:hypothetical protein
MVRLIGITTRTSERALPRDFQRQEWLISSEDLAPCRYNVYESHEQPLCTIARVIATNGIRNANQVCLYDADLCLRVSVVTGPEGV